MDDNHILAENILSEPLQNSFKSKRAQEKFETLFEACRNASSIKEVALALGRKCGTGNLHNLSKILKKYGLEPAIQNKKTSTDGISRIRPSKLRKKLKNAGIPEECLFCKITTEWLGNPIVLEIDHINEDYLDNREENLRFLCPNCHSQRHSLDQAKQKSMMAFCLQSENNSTYLNAEISKPSPLKRKSKYTKDILTNAVQKCFSIYGVLETLGLKKTGGNHSHIKKLIIQHEINCDHFFGQAANQGADHKGGCPSLTSDEIFVLNRTGRREKTNLLKKCMIESGFIYQCICGNTGLWHGSPLTLEIDHLNGNHLDNRKENLAFKCPNCHSQN